VLPLQAVLLNLLTVSAVCGLLVLVFQWGLGSYVGLPNTDAIEGWVPLLLFATLFGLSMDYEVFLVSRMREAWDETPDTARAVTTGLERSGRVVTAAAAIMIAAFAGFAAGRIVGLQQLGLGLALGVLLDAVLIRMLVLPAAIAVLGPYNWWLPPAVARIARVEPSPLRR
jgi:RND superfamily putative drug exporter